VLVLHLPFPCFSVKPYKHREKIRQNNAHLNDTTLIGLFEICFEKIYGYFHSNRINFDIESDIDRFEN